MRRKNNTSRRAAAGRGFTLIELLLVLVILAVLAAIVVPRFTGRTLDAQIKAARAAISNFSTQLDIFEIDFNRYPTTEEGLAVLLNPPDGRPPYIGKTNFLDPWGNPYVYRYPGQHNTDSYDLYSLGPDGRESDDDITNWD
jgi:general secretion pathway protein G